MRQTQQLLDGYPDLARRIARDPDNELLVFRKFDELSARNLLHLQSRIINLEKKQHQLDNEAHASQDVDLRVSLRRWERFEKNSKSPSRADKEGARMRLAEEISEKLKEYHEALLRQHEIAKLKGPSLRVYSAYRSELFGDPSGKFERKDPIIDGEAQNMLDHRNDLVSVKTPIGQDILSRTLRDRWCFIYQDLENQNSNERTRVYLERDVRWTVTAVSTVAAAILLIGAIACLYAVRTPKIRLALIACFTILFAVSIAAMTTARRAEVFGATAAYAAVLVVFVSGDLGSS